MPRAQFTNVLPSMSVLLESIPDQHGRARPAARRRDDVAEQVVPDDPVGAGVHVDAVGVVVLRRRRVLDHRVLDDAVVDAAAAAVGIAT